MLILKTGENFADNFGKDVIFAECHVRKTGDPVVVSLPNTKSHYNTESTSDVRSSKLLLVRPNFAIWEVRRHRLLR